MANHKTQIDFVNALRERGFRFVEDGSAVIVITGEGRATRAKRYESPEVAAHVLIINPQIEAMVKSG